MQNIITTTTFHREGMLDWRGGLQLGMPAMLGSLLGANIAVGLNETNIRQAIGIVMLILLPIIILRPKRWLEGTQEHFKSRPTGAQLLIFFLIGVYGGFIQAGVGIFLLAGLVLGAGYNLVYANGVKVLIVLMFTLPALFVFILNGQVQWGIAAPLAVGNAIGGWLAAKFAIERGAQFVRYILIVVVILSALWQLGVIKWLLGI